MDLGFNVMDYAPGNASETESKEYTLATPGKYKVEIVDSSEEISAAGNRYLKLKLSIMEGPHKGTWIWDNLNLYHPTESVQGLARQILGTISKACGIIGPKDTSELHYKPLFALLDVDPESNGYRAKNVVKKYFPLDPGEVKEAAEKVTKIQLDKISALPNKEADAPKVDSEPQKDGIPF
jgi:hypothetical protein